MANFATLSIPIGLVRDFFIAGMLSFPPRPLAHKTTFRTVKTASTKRHPSSLKNEAWVTDRNTDSLSGDLLRRRRSSHAPYDLQFTSKRHCVRMIYLLSIN